MNSENKLCKNIAQTSDGSNADSSCQAKQVELQQQSSLTNSATVSDKEIKRLALELKRTCNDKGVEFHPPTSAETIYKLGLEHFKQSPDKAFLIKSVGLLNSAIVRNPKNVSEIKEKLSAICQHILLEAKAENPAANLVQEANSLKTRIKVFRNETDQALVSIKSQKKFKNQSCLNVKHHQKQKIDSMKKLQDQITEHYMQIVRDLSKFCENVMGQPPCRFAIVGMGSMARREITPYSDFEHIILLENQRDEMVKSHSDYFRWFSVIFHTVILNLQETIIPSLNIMHLNDETSDLGDWFFDEKTNGISFDGMMPYACKFPLGRIKHTEKKPWITELIKPIDEMLDYLDFDEDLKNGYHLKDVLTETCLVYGDKSVFEEFQKGIKLSKELNPPNQTLVEIRKQVSSDLNKFAARLSLTYLKTQNKMNVKQTFYRATTLFVVVLGKICHTDSTSCFDILNELAVKNKISESTKHKLLFALTIACEIRLNVYMKKKNQCDYLYLHGNSQKVFDEILQIVDKDSLISYFQITYSLQSEVSKLLKMKETDLYSIPSLLNINLCHVLGEDEILMSLLSNYKTLIPSCGPERFTYHDSNTAFRRHDIPETKICIYFDQCLEKLESEINSALEFPVTPIPGVIPGCLARLCQDLMEKCQNNVEALELYIITGEIWLSMLQQSRGNKSLRKSIIDLMLTNGRIGWSIASINDVPKHLSDAIRKLLVDAHCFKKLHDAM